MSVFVVACVLCCVEVSHRVAEVCRADLASCLQPLQMPMYGIYFHLNMLMMTRSDGTVVLSVGQQWIDVDVHGQCALIVDMQACLMFCNTEIV